MQSHDPITLMVVEIVVVDSVADSLERALVSIVPRMLATTLAIEKCVLMPNTPGN